MIKSEEIQDITVNPVIGDGGLHIEEIDIDGAHCDTGNEAYIFYTEYDMIPQSNAATKACINAYDIKTKETKEVYTHTEDGFWLNEIRATEKNLYWVLLNPEGSHIQKMNLDTGEVETIAFYEAATAPTISLVSYGRWLLWYDQTNSLSEIIIKYYDEETGNIYEIKDKCYCCSPFDRVGVSDNMLTYVSEKKYPQKEIVRYSLPDQKEIDRVTAEKEVCIAYVNSNERYGIWLDAPLSSPFHDKCCVCVYDYEEHTLKRLILPKEMEDIFSIQLLRNYVVINLSGKGVYLYDMDKEALWEPYYHRNGAVYLSTVIDDTYYLADSPNSDTWGGKFLRVY